MRFSRCFSALFLGPLLWATVPAPAVFAQSAVPMASGYRQPPADILQILDAPVTPTASFSPDRRYMLLTDYQAYPPIALLARPYKKLAGLRVDPALNGTQRIRRYTGITIQNVADGKKVPLMGLPKDAAISTPDWANDGRRFAFTRDTESGIEIWVGDAEKGTAKPLRNLRVSDVLFGPFVWMNDSRHLLVAMIPTGRGPMPQRPAAPNAPVTEETAGKIGTAWTYQDLLRDEYDSQLFTYFGTTQLALVDTVTGRVEKVGKPDLYTSVRPSPDEKYWLVTRLMPPFSYRVTYNSFAQTTEVWEQATGKMLQTLVKLPIQDAVPPDGVSVGPRAITWQAKKPATLLWAEALDGGDPRKKVPFRDQIRRLEAPFTQTPTEVLRTTHRYSGMEWFDTADEVMLAEYDRDRRWRTTYFVNLNDPEKTKRVLFDLSAQDVYKAPGSPVYQLRPDGERTILQERKWIYLSGTGATPEGNRPFLRRYNLQTGATEEIFRSEASAYESFVAFANGTDGTQSFITNRQSPTDPPNYFLRSRKDNTRRALTTFPDPHPQLTGLKKELVKYTREKDGVPLSGTLYLPPNYDPASGKKLPLMLWAYPREYNDASTAGQVRGSTNTFTRLSGYSHLWFVTQGYAVLDDATIPVVGDPKTANDTFVEQIVGAAKAAIDYLDGRGIIDRKRVVVGGHSYGAFMTANLLAHSDLFAAGIARSGAYNRTLTPFGFQSERRNYWEAPETYYNMSPFSYANKVKTPILLIHGQDDNNPGTFPIQSERFYQALQANGATARLVMLPHESHGYSARESILHVLAEMFAWADKHAKNRPEPGQ